MNYKDLLRTKTFWSGFSLVLYGVYLVSQGEVNEGVQNVLTGLSVVFLRQAVAK